MDALAEPTIGERWARLRAGLQLKERDPLSFWHFAVPRLREAFALLTASNQPISELHSIGPNKGTKTQSDTAYIVRCAQKATHLDGILMPQWRGPVECVQMVLDYPQQLLSVQPAYMKVLGQWPHHARYNGATLRSLHVMPVNGNPNDEKDWSVIHFMSEEGRKNRGTRALGVRADVVGFDEPAHIETLRELRKAAHAGRRLIILDGWTPTVRSQWAPILDDLGAEIGSPQSRDRIIRIDRRRAAVRWNLSEVSDLVLSQAEKDDLLLSYLGPAMDWDHPLDPLARSRWYGDAIDTSGLCPFHLPTLDAMLADCCEPLETVAWKITQEADAVTGRVRVSRSVPVEVWEHAQVDGEYVVTIDPSSGVDDRQHDPYELHVTKRGSGDLVARAGGYLSGYLVGVLAAGIARQYNAAGIDVEVNDKWGVNVVEGVHAARYGNFLRERRDLKDGSFVEEIGFHNNAASRPKIIGAGQSWIDSWRAGIRYGKCPSRKVIDTYRNCIMDQNGKIIGAPGVHDECLIVRGQALRRCIRRAGMEIPASQPPVRSKEQMLVKRLTDMARTGGRPEGPGNGLLWAERPKV